MPLYYDVVRATSTNGTTLTETTHLWAHTLAQAAASVSLDVAIKQVAVTARSGTAGGGTVRCKYNSGAVASGGTAQTPGQRGGGRASLVASSVWANDASAITAGGTLVTRLAIGFAQTGGQGGWVPLEAADSLYMATNAANPVDVEFTSLAVGTGVPIDLTVEFSEGGG